MARGGSWQAIAARHMLARRVTTLRQREGVTSDARAAYDSAPSRCYSTVRGRRVKDGEEMCRQRERCYVSARRTGTRCC